MKTAFLALLITMVLHHDVSSSSSSSRPSASAVKVAPVSGRHRVAIPATRRRYYPASVQQKRVIKLHRPSFVRQRPLIHQRKTTITKPHLVRTGGAPRPHLVRTSSTQLATGGKQHTTGGGSNSASSGNNGGSQTTVTNGQQINVELPANLTRGLSVRVDGGGGGESVFLFGSTVFPRRCS